MAKRNTLKQEYFKLNLGWWKDRDGKPTIEYVNWLEDKLNKLNKINCYCGHTNICDCQPLNAIEKAENDFIKSKIEK